jgi:hypothetical protein
MNARNFLLHPVWLRHAVRAVVLCVALGAIGLLWVVFLWKDPAAVLVVSRTARPVTLIAVELDRASPGVGPEPFRGDLVITGFREFDERTDIRVVVRFDDDQTVVVSEQRYGYAGAYDWSRTGCLYVVELHDDGVRHVGCHHLRFAGP